MNKQHELLRGALARGYCTKENSHKACDPVLIEAMVNELISLNESEWQPMKTAPRSHGDVYETLNRVTVRERNIEVFILANEPIGWRPVENSDE